MNDHPRHWRPLIRINRDDFKPIPSELLAYTMREYNLDEAAAIALLNKEHDKCVFWINDLYQVAVTPCGPDDQCLHINIRRRDGGMFKDWRHFQQIKNEVAGPEREALEIYPAESRKVDSSNKWHLWVLPEGSQFGLGWTERDVSYNECRNVPGMRQRPL
jgi:hypothetical protein